jgi:hypothetical protein
MTKEQKVPSLWARATNTAGKRTALVLGVMLGIGAGFMVVLFITADTHARDEYRHTTSEADRISSLISKADGTLKVQAPGGLSVAASGRGNGLMDTLACGPDVSCPVADRYQLVLLPNDQEGQFMGSLLKLSGYDSTPFEGCHPFYTDSSSCYESRNNSKFRIFVVIDMADSYHHGAPEQDEISSPKVWRIVRISVEPKR